MTTLKPLGINQVRRAAHELPDLVAWVPSNTSLEDVMTPAYWANHVGALRTGARVRVLREDMTMDLDLTVIEVKPGIVKMRALRKFVDDVDVRRSIAVTSGEDITMPDGYKCIHIPNGREKGFAVMLKSTGEYLAKGLTTRGEANALAVKHASEANSTLAPGEKVAETA